MSDEMAQLTRRLLRFRDEREWKPLQTPKNLAMSVAIESGELLELFQWAPEDHYPMGAELDEARNPPPEPVD